MTDRVDSRVLLKGRTKKTLYLVLSRLNNVGIRKVREEEEKFQENLMQGKFSIWRQNIPVVTTIKLNIYWMADSSGILMTTRNLKETLVLCGGQRWNLNCISVNNNILYLLKMSNFVNTKQVPIYRLGWCKQRDPSSFFETQYGGSNIWCKWCDFFTSIISIMHSFAQHVGINSIKVLDLNNFTNFKLFVLMRKCWPPKLY